MAVLKEGQFELDGFVFGGSGPGAVWVGRVEIGAASWSSSGSKDPHSGRKSYGRSSLTGDQWKFEMSTMTGDMNGSRDLMEQLLAAWRNEDKYAFPEQLSTLRYCKGGVVRKVFGRPEELEFDQNGFLRQGSWTAEGVFDLADAHSYDDEEQVLLLPIVQTSTGGLVLPAILPWVVQPSGDRAGMADIGGYAPTPLKAKIYGPVLNPVVSGPGWKVSLNTNVLEGQTVTIDSRTNTVMRGKVSVASDLSLDSRLDLAKLRPGRHELRFSGVSESGLARCEFSWSNAFNGY